ncbi:MAG: hypothetical protein ABSA76_00160 [Bacteroidales bacterium]
MMKTLTVNKLKFASSFHGLDDISEKLDTRNEKHAIEEINRNDFNQP